MKEMQEKYFHERSFHERAFRFIREHKMLLPGERVAAGISGGADSVCLLFVLLEWKRQYGLELAAVNVNHGIRDRAGEDARFVEELCRRLEIPFFLRETDVHRLALERKCSEEEAGRDFRYEVFREVAAEFGADKIAVAHNLNDRSETMLFHLFRGTGIRGLAGMQPVRDEIIRPLLWAERREIEDYLREIGQDFCKDATNEEDIYTRNRIRHHILPYAEREVAAGCVQHMGQTAELLAETEDYLERQTQEALAGCTKREGETCYILDCRAFITFHPVLQKRMIYQLVKNLSPGARDISRVHVTDLCSLFEREGNRRICLPFGISGCREYDKVILERGQTEPFLEAGAFQEASLESFHVDVSVLSVEGLRKNEENTLIFPQNQYTKWFDYDKIKELPVFRTRAGGDYLTIRDGQGRLCHKKLKDYMVTEKIPRNRRELIPVLAEDSHVLWLVGYRISEYYKVGENTKRVLQVQLITDCGSSSTEEKNGGTCESSLI